MSDDTTSISGTEPVAQGALLWTPSAAWTRQANVTRFMAWLKSERNLDFGDYGALHRWSVTDIDAFWRAIWDYFDVVASVGPEKTLGRRTMPGAEWFPGTRLNYAQNVLRHSGAGGDALYFLSERRPLSAISRAALAEQVRTLATRLRALGVEPGDRVAAYMPNIPQTLVALLATTSIGAVWTSCSPDFGSSGVLDRLQQLTPKVLFCVDGYQYGGKPFDRRGELARIIDALPSVKHTIYLADLDPAAPPPVASALAWADLMAGPPVAAKDFAFEQVPFDHPLWVLFSSGTTGLPKAIVHGHGGIILENYKAMSFHMGFKPNDRTFFYTTTGWMMFNFLATMPMLGACPVLYDGNPAWPNADVLWKMAQDTGASFFGASPTYVDLMIKAGIVPRERYDLSRLKAVMAAGSPVSPDCAAWFYRNVKEDLWLATGSGGTDVCSGLVGGVETLPVHAGEIQAASLGVAAEAFDENGNSVVEEVGELVVTQPMPSMPVSFWNDPDGARYRESYFDLYPGVWRHGDFFKVNGRGGCYVLGRSDATLNRHGIRIGTAEIYRALSALPQIEDSLIVNLDLPGGHFFMPLFVKLARGAALDDTLKQAIAQTLRCTYTPRHVPDEIIAVPELPRTLTGKKVEVPVRRILMGVPQEKAVNPNALANPGALDYFAQYAVEIAPRTGVKIAFSKG